MHHIYPSRKTPDLPTYTRFAFQPTAHKIKYGLRTELGLRCYFKHSEVKPIVSSGKLRRKYCEAM